MSTKKVQRPALKKSAATGSNPVAPRQLTAIVTALLHWFQAHARDLPWRRTRDPYAIWVSEIMLQQTQVKTVIPYWQRWLQTLPTIEALAAADAPTIHKLWEGLGYYTRVRNLQKAAQQILTQHHGQFPQHHHQILDLPGIGPYTAGAIASIAFNQPQPILDGNVIRVLTRLFAIAENPREKSTNQKLWHLATQLVTTAFKLKTENLKLKTSRSSALNQSLMELGALLCTPTKPACPLCPLRTHCRAHQQHREESYPRLAPRPAATAQNFLALVIEHQGRYLVRQRPAGQVNAHLWEFPNHQITTAPTPSQLLRHTRQTLGLRATKPLPLCTIKHTITRYRITLAAHHLTAAQPLPATPPDTHWHTPAQLHRLPFTSAHRKILHHLPNP